MTCKTCYHLFLIHKTKTLWSQDTLLGNLFYSQWMTKDWSTMTTRDWRVPNKQVNSSLLHNFSKHSYLVLWELMVYIVFQVTLRDCLLCFCWVSSSPVTQSDWSMFPIDSKIYACNHGNNNVNRSDIFCILKALYPKEYKIWF